MFADKAHQGTSNKFTFDQDNLEKIAKENILITKLSDLVVGRYYKFVIKGYSSFNFAAAKTAATGITNITIKAVYPSGLNQNVFEIDSLEDAPAPHMCSYIKNKTEETYCKVMKD